MRTFRLHTCTYPSSQRTFLAQKRIRHCGSAFQHIVVLLCRRTVNSLWSRVRCRYAVCTRDERFVVVFVASVGGCAGTKRAPLRLGWLLGLQIFAWFLYHPCSRVGLKVRKQAQGARHSGHWLTARNCRAELTLSRRNNGARRGAKTRVESCGETHVKSTDLARRRGWCPPSSDHSTDGMDGFGTGTRQHRSHKQVRDVHKSAEDIMAAGRGLPGLSHTIHPNGQLPIMPMA